MTSARLCVEYAADYAVAYDQHYSLAQFFSENPDDKWLADHFYFNCMNVAIKVKDDGGQMRAEASINAGKVFESLGERALMLCCPTDEGRHSKFSSATARSALWRFSPSVRPVPNQARLR